MTCTFHMFYLEKYYPMQFVTSLYIGRLYGIGEICSENLFCMMTKGGAAKLKVHLTTPTEVDLLKLHGLILHAKLKFY